MARTSRWLTLSGITLGVLSLAATAFGATGWTVVAPPATPANTNDVINAASARTDSDAWAVGSTYVDAGAAAAGPIAIHWNGAAWSTVPTPAPDPTTERFAGLLGVSASSATDAWSVGFTLPITGGYSGGGNSLYDHWNGAAWTRVTGPNLGRLVGVADFSATNAVAVSGTGNVAQWNGTAWTAVTVPQPNPADTVGNSITSMSADSPTDIWAVGVYTNASYANALYALHYNGSTWSVATLPVADPTSPSPNLTSVSALSPTDVWAVGNESTSGTPVIDQFNGTSWQLVTPPAGLFYPSLSAVTARSASDVWLFGTTDTSSAGTSYELLLSHWNGSSWTTSASPIGLNVYSSISSAANSPSHVWAFGTNSHNQPLILSHP